MFVNSTSLVTSIINGVLVITPYKKQNSFDVHICGEV